MYNESDLDGAVAAGIMTRETAEAFRAHVAGGRATPAVDEEHFRLITGFNDIFVSIASILVFIAAAMFGGIFGEGGGNGLAVAAVAWGLAEYFTRVRRMALPSIIYLLVFALSIFWAVGSALHYGSGLWRGEGGSPMTLAIAAAVTAGATWLHWQRFRVPITVAAGAAALVGVALALLLSIAPGAKDWLVLIMAVAGLAVFATAMWWDMSDPERRTRRADVAFWLHLLAAPLIVHPVFSLLGIMDGGASGLEAALVLILYLALGLVALAIDRRALMVSALAYVIYAMSTLFGESGANVGGFALTALVIGSALLTLSAFWQGARRAVVTRLSEPLQRVLPPLDRIAHPAK